MRKVIKLFEKGNVLVAGLRGTGKDMLMSNVCVRRNKRYISNIVYDEKNHIELNLNDFNVNNNCVNFIEGDIRPYHYPYEDGIDIYISDATVYFPNYDFKLLNKEYPGFINYQALSRQIGANNVFCNCQNTTRLWDKLVEQSDIYIKCRKCIYIKPLKLVIQVIRVYDKKEAFENNVPPCPPRPIGIAKQLYEVMKLNYFIQHGQIKQRILIYRNKSNYDTRRFKAILEGKHA